MPYKSRWHVDIPHCSLPTLIFKSPTHPLNDEKACFLDAARPATYYVTPASYRLWCQRFALGLQRSGTFEQGDRLLLFSGNDLFYPVVFMGVIMAGGIFTGANPTFVARELAYQLKNSEAKYLLCAEASLATAVEAARLSGLPQENVFVFDGGVFDGEPSGTRSERKGHRYWGELLASPAEAKDFHWDDLRSPDDACHGTLALNYSSGTTGQPKGAEITHYNYVSNCVQYAHLAQLKENYAVLNARSRWLNFLPLYHAMSQTINIGCALLRGVPVYIMPKFDLIQMLECVQKYRISHLILVPPIVVALAKHPAVRKYDLSSVEAAGSGAAPLGFKVSTEFNKLWPDGQVNLMQGWGMTEITCSALSWHPNSIPTSNSVGELNANCEAMIMSVAEEDSARTPTELTGSGPGSAGELWVRGPNVMKGYWRNPAATAATKTQDGWLKTGDIAYVDGAGGFYIVDRLKELIKVRGQQVAPAELEAVLLEHPDVVDAAVVGVWGRGRGGGEDGNGNGSGNGELEERPRAYVVRREDAAQAAMVGERDMLAFVQDRVARYKRITGGVVFVDRIPRNASGKILRRGLRERARREEKEGEGREMQGKGKGKGKVGLSSKL